jgi:hypothetical protein
MLINDTSYYLSFPDVLDVAVQIEWTIPCTHDVLFSGLVDQDSTAFFYAIVSLQKKSWVTHYIGKVFAQNASQRHRAQDHLVRLNALKVQYPDFVFHLSLGTPMFVDGRGMADAKTIDDIEGLLIYSNWTGDMINKKRVEYFTCQRQIVIENIGFHNHLYKRSAYGVFSTED